MLSSLTLAFFLMVNLSAFAQDVPHTPAKGSAERAAILSALRIPVEKDLKQKIVFVTQDFNVQGDWAFVSGEPTTPDGKRPNLKGTAWEEAEDIFDATSSACFGNAAASGES